jgi:hypothetical protein
VPVRTAPPRRCWPVWWWIPTRWSRCALPRVVAALWLALFLIVAVAVLLCRLANEPSTGVVVRT